MTEPHGVPILDSILDSSLWAEDPTTLKVFLTFLLKMDAQGFWRVAESAVARAANVPLLGARAALRKLEAPDPESRNPDWGGRRLERVEGGWVVLNAARYRQQFAELVARGLAEGADERERQRTKKWRQRHRGEVSPDVPPCPPGVPPASPQTEGTADALMREGTKTEAKTKTEATETKNPAPAARPRRVTWLTPYWDAWIAAYGGEPAGGTLARYLQPLDERHGTDTTLSAWRRYLAETEPRFANPARFSQTFGSWLNGSGKRPTQHQRNEGVLRELFEREEGADRGQS